MWTIYTTIGYIYLGIWRTFHNDMLRLTDIPNNNFSNIDWNRLVKKKKKNSVFIPLSTILQIFSIVIISLVRDTNNHSIEHDHFILNMIIREFIEGSWISTYNLKYNKGFCMSYEVYQCKNIVIHKCCIC